MQRMAHGWDSYLQNIPTLSSDPRTSEEEHLENIIEHDFTDTMVSYEAPTTNSNITTNDYSNPSIENSRSDCAFQKYYEETQWQAVEEQMEKDLPSCGNSEITDFATDGLSTSGTVPSSLEKHLQDLKQDCGMLATSSLEDYSDVSSCSNADVIENRPSCKFTASNSAPKSAIDVGKKHSAEWPFTDPGNMLPTKSLCTDMLEINANFHGPSNVKAEENLSKCSEEKVECPETVKSYTGHSNISSSSSHTVANIGNESEDRIDSDGGQDQKQQANMEKEPILGNPPDILINDLENMTGERIEEYPDANEEEQVTSTTPNIVTTYNKPDHAEEVPKEKMTESFNNENEEFDHLNSTESQDRIMKEDKQDSEALKMETKASASLGIELSDEQNAPNSNSSDSQDENIQPDCNGNDIESNTCQSSDTLHRKLSDLKDATHEPNGQNVAKSVESSSKLNASDTEKMEWTSPAENTIATSSADQHLFPDQSLGGGIDEKARESIEEFDTSTEKDSMLGMLYGEPLSGEDSSSDTDETKLATSKEAVTVARPDSYNMDHPEGQKVQLTSSTELRNHLQPIIILEPLESVNGMSKSYRCRDCQHTTPNIDHLFEHHHGCHSIPDFQFCSTCNLYFMSNEQAEKHLCGVSNKCPQLSSDSKLQKKGKRRGKHRCIKCKLRFSKFVQYISHMRTHTGETPYKCNECGSYFAQAGTLQRHKKVFGRCRRARRRISKSAKTPNTKTLPQKQLVENKPYTNLPTCYVKLVDISKTNLCRLCGKTFLSAKKAKNHFCNLHKGKGLAVSLHQCTTKPMGEKTQKADNEISTKYKCPLCPRLFKYSYNRARHLRDCLRNSVLNCKEKVGKYLCPLCHTIFTSPSNRYRHIRQAVCLKECLSRLAKERTKLFQNEQKKRGKDMGKEHKTHSNENKDKTLLKENELKKETPTASKAYRNALRFKCNLCPAVFRHSSGKYRHMKKHELFKLTGKMFRYRNSIFSSPMSKPETLQTTKAEEKEEDLKSIEESVTFSLSCKFCGKYFSSSQSLKSHEHNHRGERPFRCLECGKGFKKRTHLICHKAVHQRRIQCTVCKKILPTIGELIQHRSSHLKKGKLQCPDCDLQFEFPVYLLRHLETHRNKEKKASQLEEKPPMRFQCSLCKKTFDDAQVLRKHCLTHISGSSSNQCPFCKHRFSCRRNLLRHMVRHTGDKPLSCRNCGKQFFRDLYLKLHSEGCFPQTASPDPKRPFKCSYCPRTFCRKIRLKCHQRGHKTNTLFLCSRCGEYYDKYKINQHQKNCGVPSELNTDSLSRDISKGTSQTSQSVRNRLLQSNASKLHQFKCPHCTQKFQFRSLLLRHLVSHTGVQPYGCIHCGHGYRSKTMCLQHEAFCKGVYKEALSNVKGNAGANSLTMPTLRQGAQKRAEGENEYKCKFCTKTFMKSRNLRRHILTHNEVNPYRCKACDSCFSRYDHLKVHQARCRGKKQRLEVCIPKISLDDVGKGWQNRFGIKPSETQETFECKGCSRSFPTQSKFFRHNQMFHVAKLFKCTPCGSSFAHATSLKKHQKKKRCKKVPTATNAPPLGTNPTENVTEPLQVLRNQIMQRIKPCFNKKYKYVCSFCPRTFENSRQLSVHTRLHTGEKPYACEYCGERFIRKDYVLRHFSKCPNKGKQKKLLCDKCGGFFSKANIENHKTNCTPKPSSSKATVCQNKQSSQSPPKGFSCAYCSSRFLLFSQLQEHFLNAHKLETVVPPVSTAPLQHHLSNIPKIKEEPLDETCDQKLSDCAKSTCKLDSAVNSGFVCPVCNMSLVNKAGLTGHLRVHSMEHPFSCKMCKKGFWNKNLLRCHFRKCRSGHIAESKATRHMEVPLKAQIDFALDDSVLVFKEASAATGSGVLQTNFSCKEELIEKSSQDSEGNQIQSSSDKEKKAVQYQCSECDKSFTDGLLLISHLEDHGRQEQEKRRNSCSKCGRVCSNPGNLTRHMMIHETNHKFSCPDCPKIFSTLAELEIHRTCHVSNRPYACKRCNLRFWTRSSLSNHYSEDHPVDVFSCRFCKKIYSVKKSLARHYRKCHQKEQKDLATIQEKSRTEQHSNSQINTADESDEDENNGSEDSDSDSAPYFPCHVCGKTFPTSESLEDHQRCHLGEKPHECEECGRCFFQASQLQQHQRMHKSEFQCQACGRGFVTLFALRKHKHTHGKSRPYRCPKCDFSFTGPSQLAEHMTTHREESFPCDICNRVFLSKSSRAEHRKSHSKSGDHHPTSVSRAKHEMSTSLSESSSVFTKELKYRCGVCNERFKDPEQLSEHGCMAAKERPYSCSDCDKYFLHASHLKKHRNMHHLSLSKSEYPCNQCNSSFSSSQQFLSHLKTHVDPSAAIKRKAEGKDRDSFKCPVCHQCYTSAIELIGHFPIHLDSTFECKICKMKFPSGRKLEEHEQTHRTPATEFECTECGQKCLGSHAFLQHHCSQQQHGMMESKCSNLSAEINPPNYQPAAEEEEVDVTGEDLFNCPHCSMQFPSKSGLLEHQNKIHLKEKPFKCDICGKTFTVRRYLREHLRRHHLKSAAAQKQFECSQCQSEFSTAQDLSLHMRLHAVKEVGEFRCDMCYKSFSRWSLLKQHQESHIGEVVYECTECDKAFAFPHLLVEHQQTHAGSSQ